MTSLRLQAFLADTRQPPGTLTYHELQGFLFAIACAPEEVEPSVWIPFVFGQREPEFDGLDEAQAITGELLALYEFVSAEAAKEHQSLPPDCPLLADATANLEPAAPVAQWARGFSRGHTWLEHTWSRHFQTTLLEQYTAIMITLMFFASREDPLAMAICSSWNKDQLNDMAESTVFCFSAAMETYAKWGLGQRQLIAEGKIKEPRSRAGKQGRNEPCRCGSGRKYKKCCGAAN
jgi:uncharacterized protein